MKNDWFFETFDRPYEPISAWKVIFNCLIGVIFFGALVFGVLWAI